MPGVTHLYVTGTHILEDKELAALFPCVTRFAYAEKLHRIAYTVDMLEYWPNCKITLVLMTSDTSESMRKQCYHSTLQVRDDLDASRVFVRFFRPDYVFDWDDDGPDSVWNWRPQGFKQDGLLSLDT